MQYIKKTLLQIYIYVYYVNIWLGILHLCNTYYFYSFNIR